MAGKAEIERKSEELLLPIVEEFGYELVDVEFVKEGADWYLRAYIDKEGGVGLDDCEKTSRAFEEKLDAEDFIDDGYILEVSSPGLTRPLKKEKDFIRNIGKPVEAHTFKAINHKKEFIGNLKSFDEEKIVLEDEEGERELLRKDISLIRQYFEW